MELQAGVTVVLALCEWRTTRPKHGCEANFGSDNRKRSRHDQRNPLAAGKRREARHEASPGRMAVAKRFSSPFRDSPQGCHFPVPCNPKRPSMRYLNLNQRSDMPERPLKLFYSYSHKDQRWLEVVRASFKNLTIDQVVKEWHDGKILPGDDWSAVLEDQMESADIFVFLVTANFLAAKGCQKEVERARALKEQYGILLFPILLTDCNYQSSGLVEQPAPGWGKPIGNLFNEVDLAATAANLRTAIDRYSPPADVSAPKGPAELANLLPYLCDRADQADPISLILKDPSKPITSSTRSGEVGKKPVVLIVHGHDRESHEGFLLRLKHRILPDQLCTGNRVPIREDDLNWTRKSHDAETLTLWLAEQVRLRNNEGVIAVLTTTIDYGSWPGGQAFLDFLNFWDRWQDTIHPEALIVAIFCKYRFEAQQPGDVRETAMREFLSNNPFARLSGVSGQVLPELAPVPVGVAQEWAKIFHREGGCSEFDVPMIIDDIAALYPNAAYLMPMAELSKKLGQIARRPALLRKVS